MIADRRLHTSAHMKDAQVSSLGGLVERCQPEAATRLQTVR